MMVTACTDDQGAVCAKAPGLSPLLEALEGKGGPLKEKVGAYMTLAERLKSDKDATLSREICQHTAQLTCVVSVDIMHDDAELNQAALQALGFCLHLPDISRAFTSDDASTVVKALCNALLKTKDKSTCTRALWCLSKQNFPKQIIKNELHSILCALEHALVQGEFQSMTVDYEALNVIIRLLEDLPDDMPTHAARWGKLLFPQVVRSAHKIRERAALAMNLGLPAMVQHQPDIVSQLVTDLKSTLVPEMMKLFASKCEVQVLKTWGNFVTLLGKALHKGGGLINCLLGVVEQGFKHTSADVKLAAFVAWRVLIDNFALEPDVLYNAKRLKLLLQPLRATSAKQELVAQAKLDTWWYLVYRLGPKAAMNFEQVCAPLLQFALGLNTNVKGMQCPSTPITTNGSGLRQGFTTPLHRSGPMFSMASPATPRLSLPPGTPGGAAPPVFKSIQLQGVEILARVLGMPSDAVGTVPKYTFTIDALSHPVITSSTTFIKLSTTLVPMVRDVICNLGDQLDEGLLFQLWQALVIHVSDMVTTATKKDSVEVLTQFLTSLQCIVGGSGLAPKSLLKFLEAVSHLPKNVLGSPSYHTGNAGLMHGTPALFLIELLLSQGLLQTTAEERFFCVLETLIDCGLTVPGTVLGFCGSVLQLVDKAVDDVRNKSIIWRIWSSIVYPLLGHIIETNEVNQGDSLDHDFSTMYASLMLPIQHLLQSDSVPQMTVKTLLKTWAELYQAFARCAAVVTTADSNLGCEELCTKILACLNSQPLKSSCVDSLIQILQVIANSFDFSSFTGNATLNNPLTPGGGTRGRVRPLGNLTAFVRLVVRMIEEIQNLVKPEKSKFAGLIIQASNSYISSPSISIVANILSVLFTNVSQPYIIEALLDKLAGPVASFFDNSGAFRCSAYPAPTWQKLEKLWTDLLTSVQTRYGGPYNSAFLASVSPLLESGLTHPKRAIKSHGLVFWNATFATVESLEYPEPLKLCFAKLKEKTPLVLPGWTDAEQQVVNETPVSQISESEASQSLIPPPTVATIPNFGAPSPQKMHGSFLRRSAQAERLFASSSPERYKSPSSFGKTGKRSVSPGKGALRGLSSPVGGKGKRDGSPAVGGAAARRRLHVDEESMGEFVFIAPSPKKTQVLTDHQKEMMRTRRVLPALYNDLEQSQDTQTFTEIMTQPEHSQGSPPVEQEDGAAASISDDSPSLFGFLKEHTSVQEKASENKEASIQADRPATAADEIEQKTRTESDQKETGKQEVSHSDTTQEGKPLTFEGIFSTVKKSEEKSVAPALAVSSNSKDDEKQVKSLPPAKTEVEFSTDSTKGEPTGCAEGAIETGVRTPEDMLPTASENLGIGQEKRVQAGNVESLLKKQESNGNTLEVVETGKEDQKVLAKDSTDDESGDDKKDEKSAEGVFVIPETQQSPSMEMAVSKADDILAISPARSGSDSQPANLKLNLTPVIKLQKLNEADLLRLSPDPSKCSFGKLDINSSPKMFTSSEEEATPNRFVTRLRLLSSDDASKSNKKEKSLKRAASEPAMPNSKSEKMVQKRAARGRCQRPAKKSLQSSQADLAELAERFELDGIEPLADETDMDQSVDQMDSESQSEQVSLSNHDGISDSVSEADSGSGRGSAGPRKVRGRKRKDVSGKQNPSTKSNTATGDNNSNLSDSYAADESVVEDSNETKVTTSDKTDQVDIKVQKKRGRPRRVKPTTLSPVEEAPVHPNSKEQTQVESKSGKGQVPARKSSMRLGNKISTEEKQEDKICEEPLQVLVSEENTPADKPKDSTVASQTVDKEALDLKDSQATQEAGSSSSIPDSQDGQLNSCDDLFESCPKDTSGEGLARSVQVETKSEESLASRRTSKRTRRPSKSKLGLGKRKRQILDSNEDSEEDNIPLAKIRHCYLDVDSQTSDSEVDFPKINVEQTPASNAKESPRIVKEKEEVKCEDIKREHLTRVKTRSEKKELGKSPKFSPKTSPKAAFARKILKRARKSPLSKKSSPAKTVPSTKVAAKISPVATRLRTSKYLSSLSASVPSKLSRKSRKVLKVGREKTDGSKVIKKSVFEEKLEEAVKEDILDDIFSGEFGDLWEDLSPIAGLSTSLPLPDSKSLLSPSPVSFIEEDIHEKDIGFTNEATVLPSENPPSATKRDTALLADLKIPNLIDAEAAENEEILSSSFELAETIPDPTEEAMESSPNAPSTSFQAIPLPDVSEINIAASNEKPQDSVAEGTPLNECPSFSPKVALPQSPVIPMKFAPSCHSSPNVSGTARIKLVDQGSPSGYIPAMYSPSGSPSGGILKRKDSASPSPSNKSRRVSFAEPISEHSPVKQFAVELLPPEPTEDKPSKVHRVTTHPPSPLVTTTPSKVVSVHSKFITTPSRRSSSSGGLGGRSRVSPSGRRISPGSARRKARQQGFVTPSTGRKPKPIRQSSQNSEGTLLTQGTQQNSLDNSIDSDYDNQESVFPDLAECGTPVERILPQLTSSMWSRGLGQLVRARNILTVGHLCSLSPTEIRSLPIRSPKISNLRKVMTNFQKQQIAKNGGTPSSTTTKKKEEGLAVDGGVEGRGAETKATEGRKEIEEGPVEKQDLQAPATPSEPSTSKEATTSKEEKAQSKQGTKRKHDEVESGSSNEEESSKPKQAKIVDKLEDLVGEFATEKLAELPSERLFLAHQHVNSMMESIMAALKVKVKSPSLSS
ncbi:telomere-associated protein RIF1-like [Patiria miniata]|uniref:Telomere-associated protein Rif1 N-terminal domain-containing protein n=1 Tax=Patiria miniata TaxID=46514 RepID=A0A913YZX7_PATMI|nr:telomere-associated protein RIF1-like [Patiria miniata]